MWWGGGRETGGNTAQLPFKLDKLRDILPDNLFHNTIRTIKLLLYIVRGFGINHPSKYELKHKIILVGFVCVCRVGWWLVVEGGVSD